MRDKKLEIVIPVFNEGSSICKVYNHLKSALNQKLNWIAYFIYDFDSDTTIPFLLDLQKRDSRVIPLKQNLGKGFINAIKYGFLQVTDGAVAVVMGDDSDDLETLPLMYQKYEEGAAIVSSSRYSKGGKYLGGSFIKKNMSRIAGYILYSFGIGTKDPTNNFKLYSAKFLNEIEIESVSGELALELTIKAAKRKLPIVDVPGIWKDREEGVSKFKLLKWLPNYLKWFFFYFFKK